MKLRPNVLIRTCPCGATTEVQTWAIEPTKCPFTPCSRPFAASTRKGASK